MRIPVIHRVISPVQNKSIESGDHHAQAERMCQTYPSKTVKQQQ